MPDSRIVRWFPELGLADIAIAGGKGANLGELAQAGFPIPAGFVITAQAHLRTLQEGGIREDLVAVAAGTPADDPATLTEVAQSLARRVLDVEIPSAIAAPILSAYRRLGASAVAVRSSATSEDTTATSFAGMHESFTNVRGEAELLSCLRECWASVYAARAIAYRRGQHVTAEPAMAVVVQTMVASERSGVMFTADPSTGHCGHVVIEAAFGLGEVVAGGHLVPDSYVLDSAGPRLLEVRIGYKDHMIVAGADGHDVRIDLSADEATRRVLSDEEAAALAALGLRVQQHYGRAQDLEWAIHGGTTYLVQTRPLADVGFAPDVLGSPHARPVRGRLVAGLGAAVGIAVGQVRVLRSPEHAELFQTGEILVAPTTSPDWMPILRRAAAVVTDGGGITCHTAIVCRELGIPLVVGAGTATHLLHDGQQVTVDGRRGIVEEWTSSQLVS
jgi:pyruvate,water dikinase